MTITADRCVADGGLINPEAFPAKSSDLDTSKITGSASDLRSMGTTVKTQVGDIDRSWGGLKSHYEAPEQDRVYELMDPAVTSASDLKTTLGKVAGYLDTYASTLDGIKPRLADLERRARAFRADVIDGVKVDASEAKDASFGEHAKGAIDWVPGVDEKQVTVPWNEDGDTVSKNEDLLGEYAGLLEEITTAVAKCANDTNALVENMCVAPVEATPAEAFTNPQQPMPWGSAVEEDRNCPESVGHGAKNFGTGLAEGAGMLVLGYNPDNGEFFTGDGYGQSWGGLGDLLGSTVVTSAAGWTQMAYAATGHDRDEMPDWTTSEWMEERADVTVGGWGQMVGYDHQAATNGGDGWHKWKDDGWAAGTESVLNVGTFFIPGAGTAGAVVKGGSGAARASRIARIADGVADFALPGGSWAVRGGTQLTSKLRFLDGFNNGVPSAITRGAGRPDAPYAGLINAVDDIPPTGPGRHTPVSDTTFGGDRSPDVPEGDGPPLGTSPEGVDAPNAGAGDRVPERPGAPDDPTGTNGAQRPATPDSRAPEGDASPEQGGRTGTETGTSRPGSYNPDAPVRETVPAKDAETRYTPDDVQRALDDAPQNEWGDPVDHRNGKPLQLENVNGDRGWEMRWDPESNGWVAENRGLGEHGLPAKGEPDSFGYDANGDRMPYANHRPDYAEGQVDEVWDAAKDENGEVWVTDRNGDRVQIEWEPGQARKDVWDMGHVPDAQYRDLRKAYLDHDISLKDFLDEYRDVDNYRVEHPGRNRSHVDEISDMAATGDRTQSGMTAPDGASAADQAPRTFAADQVTGRSSGDVIDEMLTDRGMTREEFNQALLEPVPADPAQLTPEQVALRDIRAELGAPRAGEPMQKVLTPEAYEKYMTGEFEGAQGSVTTLEDGAVMRTPKDLYDGLALGYDGSPFSAADDSMKVMRFTSKSDAETSWYSSMGGSGKTDGWTDPYTGNGYTKSIDPLVPESTLPGGSTIERGAEMWSVRKDGTEVLDAVFTGKKWVKFQ